MPYYPIGSGGGDVTGASSSQIGQLAFFDSITGKSLSNSIAQLDGEGGLNFLNLQLYGTNFVMNSLSTPDLPGTILMTDALSGMFNITANLNTIELPDLTDGFQTIIWNTLGQPNITLTPIGTIIAGPTTIYQRDVYLLTYSKALKEWIASPISYAQLAGTPLALKINIDLNSNTDQPIFTVPSDFKCIINYAIAKDASTALTASLEFSFASPGDVISPLPLTDLVNGNLATTLYPHPGAAIGQPGQTFSAKPSTLQGSAATVYVDVFGYFYPAFS